MSAAEDQSLPTPALGAAVSKPSELKGYAAAFVAVAVVTLFQRLALQPLLGARPSLLLFVLPVLFAGYVGSTRHALFATLLGMLSSCFFFIEPIYAFIGADADGVMRLTLFAIVGTSVSFLSGRFKAANAAMR